MSLAGFEPTAFRLGGGRSIHLSYKDMAVNYIIILEFLKVKVNKSGYDTKMQIALFLQRELLGKYGIFYVNKKYKTDKIYNDTKDYGWFDFFIHIW